MDKNQGDEPLSSEELLRRAREGLGESTTPPPADFEIESYPPPAPEPETSEYIEPDYAEPETPEYPEPAAPQYPVPQDRPEPPPTWDDEPSRESDNVAGWAPPPVDSTPSPPATGPAPVPVKRQAGSLLSKVWIFILIGVGVVGVLNFLDSSKNVGEIDVGDCMNRPGEDEFFEIDLIDCGEPHELELYANIDLSAESSDYSLLAPYPGDIEVADAAFEACRALFDGFVGKTYDESLLDIYTFTPSFEGWTEFDDRTANCLIFAFDPDTFEILMTTGTLRNSGR